MEFTTVGIYSLVFEAGGLMFLLHLVVGIILKPYSDVFMRRDMLNKAFKIDAKE